MNKMSESLVVLLALCVFSPASAQVNLGVLGGLNLARIEVDPKPEGLEISNLTAFGFGGVLDYSLNESIALRLEPMYLQKGYKSVAEMYNLIVEGEEKHTYIEFPVMLKYAFGTSEIKPFIIAGPTIGYLLSAKMKSNWDGQSTEIDFKDSRKTFDFGLCFGAGVSVPMSNNSIFLEARYALGLTNIFDNPDESGDPDSELKTRGIHIFAGITFPIGK